MKAIIMLILIAVAIGILEKSPVEAQELIAHVQMTKMARALVAEIQETPQHYALMVEYQPDAHVPDSVIFTTMYGEQFFTIPKTEIAADVWHYISKSNYEITSRLKTKADDYLSKEKPNVFMTEDLVGNPTFVVVSWKKDHWMVSTEDPSRINNLEVGAHFFVRYVNPNKVSGQGGQN